jgi:hypothetical protein
MILLRFLSPNGYNLALADQINRQELVDHCEASSNLLAEPCRLVDPD